MLGPPGVKDTCREALEEERTSVSLPSDDSRRRVRKDSQKNEQETTGRVERGPQAPLLSPLLMAQSVGVIFALQF